MILLENHAFLAVQATSATEVRWSVMLKEQLRSCKAALKFNPLYRRRALKSERT